MDFVFLRGLLIGFSIAAPVGPIGVLCIRRTLAHGRLVGFLSGLGAATADACYGAIAAFGLAWLSGWLLAGQSWLRLVGGLFLLYLGLRTFLAKPGVSSAAVQNTALASSSAGEQASPWQAYLSTVFLTLTNPMTILSFTAIFSGLGVVSDGSWSHSAALVLGVFIGSALWWLLLSALAGAFRRWLDAGRMVWVNRLSGVVIMAFGILALASLLGA